MNLQHSVYDGDLPPLYPEDDDLAHADGVLHPVGEEQQVSSVERRLHAATGTTQAGRHFEWWHDAMAEGKLAVKTGCACATQHSMNKNTSDIVHSILNNLPIHCIASS